MHCISLAILRHLSPFHSPTVGTNWLLCWRAVKRPINNSWMTFLLHFKPIGLACWNYFIYLFNAKLSSIQRSHANWCWRRFLEDCIKAWYIWSWSTPSQSKLVFCIQNMWMCVIHSVFSENTVIWFLLPRLDRQMTTYGVSTITFNINIQLCKCKGNLILTCNKS